jgi:hypothetical protein
MRVDRAKKMNIEKTTATLLEDPSQPDWVKLKSLRQLELIKDSKKAEMFDKVLQD